MLNFLLSNQRILEFYKLYYDAIQSTDMNSIYMEMMWCSITYDSLSKIIYPFKTVKGILGLN